MATKTARTIGLVWGGIMAALLLLVSAPVIADDPDNPTWTCLIGQHERIRQGFDIAPVPLNLEGRHLGLVGLGSYIVNAQVVCSDCHTNPPYAEGGNPFLGEPEQINTAGYLAGGTPLGPDLFSTNITPCEDGKPSGLTRHEFIQVMRTGIDPKDNHILQAMPWPIYQKMTDCDLSAIYEFLKTIPPHEGCELPKAP
jgi:hypothetical protein